MESLLRLSIGYGSLLLGIPLLVLSVTFRHRLDRRLVGAAFVGVVSHILLIVGVYYWKGWLRSAGYREYYWADGIVLLANFGALAFYAACLAGVLRGCLSRSPQR
jgi:hypothetical protein